MKVTLPNGTTIEGTKEELEEGGYLPPPPQYNWDGPPTLTCKTNGEGPLAGMTASATTLVSGLKEVSGMRGAGTLSLREVEEIPETLEPGILYYSSTYGTASHLCPCGCGHRVVTPIKPGFWNIGIGEKDGVRVATLTPSVGNFGIPCASHYFIREGKVVWA